MWDRLKSPYFQENFSIWRKQPPRRNQDGRWTFQKDPQTGSKIVQMLRKIFFSSFFFSRFFLNHVHHFKDTQFKFVSGLNAFKLKRKKDETTKKGEKGFQKKVNYFFPDSVVCLFPAKVGTAGKYLTWLWNLTTFFTKKENWENFAFSPKKTTSTFESFVGL